VPQVSPSCRRSGSRRGPAGRCRSSSLGEHELEIDLDVAEGLVGADVGGPPGAVHHHAARRRPAVQLRRSEIRLESHRAGREPLVLRFSVTGLPAGEILAVQERLPALLEEVRRIAVRIAVLHGRVARRTLLPGQDREKEKGDADFHAETIPEGTAVRGEPRPRGFSTSTRSNHA
jgi:hypothetical protein